MVEGQALIELALFGHPVAQSRSPWIHARFAKALGIDIRYRALDCERGHLAASLEVFAAEGGAGCNITLPLKHEARSLARTVSERVRRADAANTLTRTADGWVADSTDGVGLVRDLEAAEWSIADERVAILGAGGATASVLATVLEAGPAEVLLFNRTLERAQALAQRHADLGPVRALGLADWADAGRVDLLLNATSVGHAGQAPDLAGLERHASLRCYDLNYGAAATPLERWCKERGVAYRDGLGMLVEQAAASFAVWTGQLPDTEMVSRDLRARL